MFVVMVVTLEADADVEILDPDVYICTVSEGGRIRPALFIVPTDAPGFEYQPIDMELVAPERQFFCYFDDVEVPAENVVGGSLDAALPALFAGLNPERITVAAFSIGTARYALKQAARYANERTVWKAPIGTHQGLSHPLAKAYIETELAKLMVYKAADLHDRGDALAAGARVYDLRGITDTLTADDDHVGLIQFKVGTGGEAVEHVGEWDLPLNKALYAAFDLYMRRRG